MANPIRFDTSGRPEEPTFVLATKGGAKLGNLIAIEGQHYHSQFMNADEICFDINQYVDGVLNPLWDSIMDFKLAWYQEIDRWFEITVELDESDKRVKHVEGKALCESELSQTNIYDVEINTETDIANDDYQVTVFYDPTDGSKSLLNRVLYKNSNYTIGHVDSSLRNIQRSFSWSSSTTYDALQDIASEVGCVFLFGNGSDSNGLPSRTINAYDLMYTCLDCGHRFEGNRATCPKCGSALISEPFGDETGIIVSRDNLTDDIQYSSATSNVKNCFKLEAGDDVMTAAVRQVMADGSGYLWHFSDDMKADMSDDLKTALAFFDEKRDEYNTTHKFNINSDSYNYIVDKYVNGTPTLISDPAKLSVTTGIAIDKTPSDFVGITGEDATFSVSASGSGLTYQWQSSRDSGANWVNLTSTVTGYNTDTITVGISEENIGYIYRCLITDNNSNSVCSSSAVLTTVTTADYGICGGNLNWYLDTGGTLHIYGTGAMTNYASGEAPWYSHRADIQKVIIKSGVTTVGSYAFMSCTSLSKTHIPTSVTAIGDSAFRNCAYLDMIYIPSGVTTISQYAFYNCNALGNVYMSGSVTSIGLNAFLNCYSLYQVNYGSTESDWEGIAINATGNGALTDAEINYNFTILSGPDDNLVATGDTASFWVITEIGSNCGTIAYQWQYSNDGGTSWKNLNTTTYPSALTDTLEFNALSRFNGFRYRCVITQAVGVGVVTYYSAPGLLTLSTTTIVTQPEDQTYAVDQTATYSVVAYGSSLSYQWQYSTDSGATWKDLKLSSHPSANTSVLTFLVKAKYNEYQYRCEITDSNDSVVYSNPAAIYVVSSFSILTQPESVIAANGSTVTFTVVASGSNLYYHWQYSADNGTTWNSLDDVSASVMSVTASAINDGWQYRCIVTGSGGASTGRDFLKIYSGDSSVTSNGTIRLIGYPSLVEAYYSSSDLYYYLHDSMMPDYTVEERTIDDQLDDLVDGLSDGITVASVTKNTSAATIETFIKSLSKLYMEYSKYSVLVSTSTWTPSSGSGVWQGTITLMNREDSTDDATSEQFTINVTTDADDLYAQSIAYKLEEYDSASYDISGLFAMEMDDFVEALGDYSLACLEEFLQCAEGCRSVLIDGGLGTQGNIDIGGTEWDGYEEMYVPFTTKILAIQSEVDARATELAIVEQMVDDLMDLMDECHEVLNLEDYLRSTQIIYGYDSRNATESKARNMPLIPQPFISEQSISRIKLNVITAGTLTVGCYKESDIVLGDEFNQASYMALNTIDVHTVGEQTLFLSPSVYIPSGYVLAIGTSTDTCTFAYGNYGTNKGYYWVENTTPKTINQTTGKSLGLDIWYVNYDNNASLWNEFLAYRREDEYKNDNYISDGLTDAEIIDNARQFLLAATEAIYKASELQHTIKSSLHNLLAIPEFSSLTDHFAVGAWIWIIVDDKPYRLRLLEFEVDWDNLDKIDVEFSDVETTSSGVSDLASLFKSASSMASSYGGTVRNAKEGDHAKSTIDAWYKDGIRATATKISNADSQTMVMDENGMLLRRMDDLSETYDSEQAKWINTTLAFTDDGWQTVRVAIGKIVVDGVEHYGILADCVYGQFGRFVTLDADQLTVGTIQDATGTNYWNLETGELHLAAVSDEMSALNDSIANAYAAINMTSQSIQTTVAASYSDMKDYVDSQVGGVSTTITQTANEIRYDFGQTTNGLSQTIANNQSELEKYIRFVDGTIQLGEVGNAMSAELSSEELAFKENDQTVAYISNNSLMITNAEVENKLSIGVNTRGWFDFIPRANGNMSLVWKAPTAPNVSPSVTVILSQPTDMSCAVDETAAFSVSAVGPGTLSYQWQYQQPGETWKDLNTSNYPSGATPNLTFTALTRFNNYQYRCKITDGESAITYSNAATFTIQS